MEKRDPVLLEGQCRLACAYTAALAQHLPPIPPSHSGCGHAFCKDCAAKLVLHTGFCAVCRAKVGEAGGKRCSCCYI